MARIVFIAMLLAAAVVAAGCSTTQRQTPPEPAPPETVRVEPVQEPVSEPPPAQQPQPLSPQATVQLQTWAPLLDRLQADGFDPQMLQALFSRPEAQYDSKAMEHKLRTLYTKKFGSRLVLAAQTGLDTLGYNPGKPDGKLGSNTRNAIRAFEEVHSLAVTGKASKELLAAIDNDLSLPKGQRPQARPYSKAGKSSKVFQSIINPERLAEAKEFYTANYPLLQEIDKSFGLPPEITVGILTVETRVGKYLGKDLALVSLASMALCADYSLVAPMFADEYPTQAQTNWLRNRSASKSDWAYDELKALLRHCAQNNHDPLAMPGSVYGAIGISQFMPSNALKYGLDGNNDGRVDLFNIQDALHSMGNYLQACGWTKNMTNRSAQGKKLYHYNHSWTYVNTILAVADYLSH